MDYLDYLNIWTTLGGNFLIIISITYAIYGLYKLYRLKKYKLFAAYIIFIIGFPFLFNLIFYIASLLTNDLSRLWFIFPFILGCASWLLVGFLINSDVEKIKSNTFIPFYKSGSTKKKEWGLFMFFISLIIYILGVYGKLNNDYLFIISFFAFFYLFSNSIIWMAFGKNI
jgi:hypothetical protein